MATTRRPDLSKKTDAEVYDLLGFHVSEAFKRISSTKTTVLTIDGEPERTPIDSSHKKAKPAVTEGDEMVGDFDLNEDDEFDPFADPAEEEDDITVEEEGPKFTSEDVRLALKAFSVIHSREAAVEIMIKVAKTDSVAKIDPKHYAKIIELAKIKRAKK